MTFFRKECTYLKRVCRFIVKYLDSLRGVVFETILCSCPLLYAAEHFTLVFSVEKGMGKHVEYILISRFGLHIHQRSLSSTVCIKLFQLAVEYCKTNEIRSRKSTVEINLEEKERIVRHKWVNKTLRGINHVNVNEKDNFVLRPSLRRTQP